jgi:hypothetical protein
MNSEHSGTPAGRPDCIVLLTEHRDGWSISVTTDGGAAVFHSHHRDKQTAVASAIAAAVDACGDLMIVTRQYGVALVPSYRLAVDEWPPEIAE